MMSGESGEVEVIIFDHMEAVEAKLSGSRETILRVLPTTQLLGLVWTENILL